MMLWKKGDSMVSKPKLIIVLGSGGHTTQMLRVMELLHDSYDFEYVVNDDDNKSIQKIDCREHIKFIPRPRKIYDKSVTRSAIKTILSIIKSFNVIYKSDSVGIVSAGPGLAVPLFIWASIFGKKRIFIESWSRVNTKSTTGKICYYLSDLFFVQWPELTKRYPKAIYAGRLG